MRLIDADKIIYSWMVDADGEEHDGVTLQSIIRKMPTIEPERQTGHWVNNIHDLPICDQCGYMTPYDRAIDDYEYGNFCPNCGAKMEAQDDN